METLKLLAGIDLNYFTLGLMVVFYTLESLMTNQINFGNRLNHWANNFLFLVLFIGLNFIWANIVLYCIGWLNNRQTGLFYVLNIPYWVKLIVGVAMFDLVTYWFHRLSHIVPFLWRFHRVHHSDTQMDASTNFRGHPFEFLFWFSAGNILAAGIFGLDLLTFGLYFFIVTPLFFIEHANLRFPAWLDKTAGLIFTTPNIHKVHHDQDQHFTDSNFADIFILWDRIFGTFTYKPAGQVKPGLEEFDNDKRQKFWYLLISPFLNVKKEEKGK